MFPYVKLIIKMVLNVFGKYILVEVRAMLGSILIKLANDSLGTWGCS
jgi:hypothetical protein